MNSCYKIVFLNKECSNSGQQSIIKPKINFYFTSSSQFHCKNISNGKGQ